jgi:hypothetical protein
VGEQLTRPFRDARPNPSNTIEAPTEDYTYTADVRVVRSFNRAINPGRPIRNDQSQSRLWPRWP